MLSNRRLIQLWVLTAGLVCAVRVQAAGSIVINELMASNSGTTFPDPQGEADDWIELYNAGPLAIDVGGMYLTDDLAKPTKWKIPVDRPAETTIPSQGYLVIWADGDVADTGLHASFSLSSEGEEVALFDRDGVTLLDHVVFGPQRLDISYGRDPDGSDTWYPMTYPTPGEMNFRIVEGIVDKPQFDHDHGFYDQPVDVTITCETPGVTLYYTTDGSDPYVTSTSRIGATATPYSGPLRIGKTTCLRAVGTRLGWANSVTETRTYLFIADILQQSPTGGSPGRGWPTGSVNGQVLDYGMDPDVVNDPRYKDLMDDALLSIPSICLATEPANLFDSQKGIYVNARMQTETWERPVSVELIYPDGTAGFQIDAGLRIRGGYSRSGSNPKHAFRLFFRSQYGQAKLRYPLFGDEGADVFENVDLRTSQNYSWSFEGGSSPRDTFVREVFSRDTQRDMGQPYTRSRYYHLYLDGQYWGLYETQERAEAYYAQTYLGSNKEDYDVVKSRAGNGGYDVEATDGTLDAWRRLWDATLLGFGNDENYYRVQGLNPDGTANPTFQKLLDVDNLIDYMLCTYYVGDPDGPVSAWALVPNNFYAICNHVTPDGFKFFRHDAEHSLYDLNENRLFAASTMAVGQTFNQSNPLWLHTHLMAHPEYRMRFADRVYKHFFNDGVLTPQRCTDRFMARAGQIDLAIIAESARWGDAKRARPRTKDDDWLPDITGMVKNYFPRRTDVVLGQFKAQGWYPSVDPPVLNPTAGHVATGSSLQMQSSKDVYYTLDGTDPRPPETPAGSVATQTLVAEDADKRVWVPKADVDEAWKGGSAFDDSSWQLATGGPGGVGYRRGSTTYDSLITLNVEAAMYQVASGCYFRIPFQVTADPSLYADLILRMRYDDGFIAYLNGVEVRRAGLITAPKWNSVAIQSRDAGAPESFSISQYLGLLHQGSNILAIHGLNSSKGSSDFLITASLDAVEAASQAGSHPLHYAGPVTLERSTHVKARARSGSVWSPLVDVVFGVGPVAQDLRISEIMYHPLDAGIAEDPNAEFLELTNIGTEAINLNLVRFDRGIDFTFPDFVLSAGGYCLIVRDTAAFTRRYGPGLPVIGQYDGSLDNAGETLELVDAVGTVISSFRYRDDWYRSTDGGGLSLTVRDPKTADPNALGDGSLWRPSVKLGGSPGVAD
jgi:hypothetical protein